MYCEATLFTRKIFLDKDKWEVKDWSVWTEGFPEGRHRKWETSVNHSVNKSYHVISGQAADMVEMGGRHSNVVTS